MVRTLTQFIIIILLTFTNIFAQGTQRIYLKDFKGLFTNADPHDIGDEYLLISKDARTYNSRILKDFVPAAKYTYSITASIYKAWNPFTFINNRLTNGYLYTNAVPETDGLTNVWAIFSYTPFSEDFYNIIYHSQIDSDQAYNVYQSYNTPNPVIQISDEIRYLPGLANYPSKHKAEGLIIQYIDRNFFDSTFTPKAQFYTNATTIKKPTFSVTLDTIPGGDLLANQYYYRFSYLYDGIQESLLSDPYAVTVTDSQWVKAQFSIDTTKHNKRITAIKVYRSTVQYSGFDHIHTIDLTRSQSEIIKIDSLGYYGKYNVLVNSVADIQIYSTDYYSFRNIGGNANDSIVVDSGSVGSVGGELGHRIFHISALPAPLCKRYWNASWVLYRRHSGVSAIVDSGSSGLYSGNDLFLAKFSASDSVKYYNLDPVGALLQFNSRGCSLKVITDGGSLRAFKYDTLGGLLAANSQDNVPFVMMFPYKGLYYWTRSGITETCRFYDAGLISGAAHPLEGEVSIDVNGKYAVMIQDRLFQGNIYLAPASPDSELHEDWISYSELGQYDVNPVSNVIRISDYYGGAITGVATLMGNPVIMKQHSISMLDIRSDPATPSNWQMIQAINNIGNVAPQGYINVMGTLYVCDMSGIYAIRPNNLAAYESTPVINFRISEPINDVYLAYTDAQKAQIKVGYDQTFGELCYVFSDSIIYLYNINDKSWRGSNKTWNARAFCYDESGNLMYFNTLYGQFWKIHSGSTNMRIKSKVFMLDYEIPKIIRNIFVTYKSATDTISVNTYWDNLSTVQRDTLTISSYRNTRKVPINFRAKKTMVEITSPSSANDVEIDEIVIEYDK